jgi:hypothetical protein
MVAKVAGGVIIAFLVFYVVVSPDNAAEILKSIWGLVEKIANGIKAMLDNLAS